MNIPRLLHQIWVGPLAPPTAWMETWKDYHPSWNYTIWTNEDLSSGLWFNRSHMITYYRMGMFNAVADLMRYELLYNFGGVVLAADSICLHPIDELFDDGNSLYTISTEYPGNRRPANEGATTPLYAARPRHPFTGSLIQSLRKTRQLGPATRTTGNRFMQRMIKLHRPAIKVWPMHFFIPEHYNGWKYQGPDRIYAKHFWGTTRNTYNQGRKKK